MDESNTGKLRKIIALALKKSPSRTPAHIASFVLEIAPELVQNWALERLAILVRLETKGTLARRRRDRCAPEAPGGTLMAAANARWAKAKKKAKKTGGKKT